MSHRRNRAKQILTLTDRLTQAAEEARAKAEALDPGEAKDLLLEKARQFEAQIGMNGFLETRGARLD